MLFSLRADFGSTREESKLIEFLAHKDLKMKNKTLVTHSNFISTKRTNFFKVGKTDTVSS